MDPDFKFSQVREEGGRERKTRKQQQMPSPDGRNTATLLSLVLVVVDGDGDGGSWVNGEGRRILRFAERDATSLRHH